jgi:hypothetical protein
MSGQAIVATNVRPLTVQAHNGPLPSGWDELAFMVHVSFGTSWYNLKTRKLKGL